MQYWEKFKDDEINLGISKGDIVQSELKEKLLDWLYARLLKRMMFCDSFSDMKRSDTFKTSFRNMDEMEPFIDKFIESKLNDENLLKLYREKIEVFSKLDFDSKVSYFVGCCGQHYINPHNYSLDTDNQLFDQEWTEMCIEHGTGPSADDDMRYYDMTMEDLAERKEESLSEALVSFLNYDFSAIELWKIVCLFEGMFSVGDIEEQISRDSNNINVFNRDIKFRKRWKYSPTPFLDVKDVDIDEFFSLIEERFSGKKVDDEVLDQILSEFTFGEYWRNAKLNNYHSRGRF